MMYTIFIFFLSRLKSGGQNVWMKDQKDLWFFIKRTRNRKKPEKKLWERESYTYIYIKDSFFRDLWKYVNSLLQTVFVLIWQTSQLVNSTMTTFQNVGYFYSINSSLALIDYSLLDWISFHLIWGSNCSHIKKFKRFILGKIGAGMSLSLNIQVVLPSFLNYNLST